MTLREEAAQRADEQRKQEADRKRFASDIRAVAATAEGKRVLRWLIEQGKLFEDDFQPNATAAYLSGVKAIPRRLWKALGEHADRNDFITICIGEKNHA